MSEAGTELEIGAQTRAAERLRDAVEPLQTTLTDLVTTIEGAADGFRGASAGGLVEALQEWLTVARDLSPVLDGYASRLTQVDVSNAGADERAVEAMARISGRMGQGPR